MSTELPLYRVLEEEYDALHGTVPRMPSSPLLLSHLTDGASWLRKLRASTDEISRHLRGRLPTDVRDQLDAEWSGGAPSAPLYRAVVDARSEERRVGKECFVPCRSRWSPYH